MGISEASWKTVRPDYQERVKRVYVKTTEEVGTEESEQSEENKKTTV